jgi:hypothetical protein
MAKNTYKFDVDVSSKSLTKLKKTISGIKVQLDKSSVGELEDAMADLSSELTINTAHLDELTKVIEKVTSGGVRPSDMMGGGAISGGGADILQKILETLEQNGQNIKQLTEDTSGHITFEQRSALKGQNLMAQNIGHNQMMMRKMMQGMIGQQGGNPLSRMLRVGGGLVMNKVRQDMDDMLAFEKGRTAISGELGGAVKLNKTQKKALAAEHGIGGDIETVQGKANSKMGQMMMKINDKLGGKGMAIAGGIGLGAMGAAGLVKKGMSALIESSPMLKQMVKLLNFGVMMILRPIGDFFGFVFRPILMMLLTKFILPWYQKMMPAMISLGEVVGTKLARALEAFMSGDIVEAFDQLFGDVLEGVDWWKLFYDIISVAIPTIGIGRLIYENVDWEKLNQDIASGLAWAAGGIQTALDNLTTWFDETFGENSWFGQVQQKSKMFWQTLINGMIGWLKDLPIVGGLFAGLQDVDFSTKTNRLVKAGEFGSGNLAMDAEPPMTVNIYGNVSTEQDYIRVTQQVQSGYLDAKAKGGK